MSVTAGVDWLALPGVAGRCRRCGWPGSGRRRSPPAHHLHWCLPGRERNRALSPAAAGQTGRQAHRRCPGLRAVPPAAPRPGSNHPRAGPMPATGHGAAAASPDRPRVRAAGRRPAGGCLIEALLRPLDGHQRAADGQRRLDPVQHLADVRDMVQRRARHHRAGRPGRLITFELDPVVAAPVRRLRIDTGSVVPGRTQHRDKPAQPPAPDLDHPGGRGRQPGPHERPHRGKPPLVRRHAARPYARGSAFRRSAQPARFLRL